MILPQRYADWLIREASQMQDPIKAAAMRQAAARLKLEARLGDEVRGTLYAMEAWAEAAAAVLARFVNLSALPDPHAWADTAADAAQLLNQPPAKTSRRIDEADKIEIERLRKVAEAARCIRHWHDREGGDATVVPLAPLEQLLAFCDWERKHNPHPAGKPHIAEWAAAEIERLAIEADELHALYNHLADLLSRTAVALRGPEPPLTRWSWHDLPERAAAAIAAIDLMQRVAVMVAEPGKDERRGEGANRPAGRPCPDCGAKPGEQHNDWCDVERCPDCGGQLISCDCKGEFTMPRLPWTGEWPGVMECREFGWYSKLAPGKGWQPCSRDDPDAREDLNRLDRDAVWSKDLGRFILPANAELCGPREAG